MSEPVGLLRMSSPSFIFVFFLAGIKVTWNLSIYGGTGVSDIKEIMRWE